MVLYSLLSPSKKHKQRRLLGYGLLLLLTPAAFLTFLALTMPVVYGLIGSFVALALYETWIAPNRAHHAFLKAVSKGEDWVIQEIDQLVNDHCQYFLYKASSYANRAFHIEFGDTALIMAAYHGHIEVVARLLQVESIDVNQAGYKGTTALWCAAYNGHNAVVKYLLAAQGIDVNHANNNGSTALMLAAQNGHIEVVKYLLAAQGIDVNHAKNNGSTALMLAACNGHDAVVDRLLQVESIDVNHANNVGLTALSCAACNGHNAVVARLLQVESIDVNHANNNGDTALSYAACNGHDAVVDGLLQVESIDVNHANNNGDTALSYAAWNGHHEIVARLLQVESIDVNHERNDGKTALMVAVSNGHPGVFHKLCAGCDHPYALLVQRDRYKRDLLEIAAPEIKSIVQNKIKELLSVRCVPGNEPFYFAYGHVAHIIDMTQNTFYQTADEQMLADCICAASRGVFDKDFHKKLSGGTQKEQPTKQELVRLLQAIVAARWHEYNRTIKADSCYAPYFLSNNGKQPIDGMTEAFSADAKQREIAKMYLLKHAFKHRDRHQKLTELPFMRGYLVYQDDEDNDYGRYEDYENFRTFIVPSLHYKVNKYFSDQPQVAGEHYHEGFHGTKKEIMEGTEGILIGGLREGKNNAYSQGAREVYAAEARRVSYDSDYKNKISQAPRDLRYIGTTTDYASSKAEHLSSQAFVRLTAKYGPPSVTSSAEHGVDRYSDYVRGPAEIFRLRAVTCFAPA